MQSPGFLGYNDRVGCICHQHRHNVQRHVADLLVWYDMLNYQPKKRKQVKLIRNMKDLKHHVWKGKMAAESDAILFSHWGRQRHQCTHNLKKLRGKWDLPLKKSFHRYVVVDVLRYCFHSFYYYDCSCTFSQIIWKIRFLSWHANLSNMAYNLSRCVVQCCFNYYCRRIGERRTEHTSSRPRLQMNEYQILLLERERSRRFSINAVDALLAGKHSWSR